MASLNKLLYIFSKSIYVKVKALKSLDLTDKQESRITESISDDIKKCSNFMEPQISVAAFEIAKRIGVDLSSKNWHDQRKFDNDRRVFHFEHMNPVSSIKELCIQANSDDEVFDTLAKKLKLVWILKKEDDLLTKLGYRSKRPNPEKAYVDAKIEIMKK